MAPHLPVEDPSKRGSLVDLTVDYVRGNLVLRVVLVATILNHVGAVALVVLERLRGEMAGLLALLSVLSWFFAVCLPVISREARIRMGGARFSYWGEMVEMFAAVVLCVQTGLFSAILVYASALG
jgi:hypothetical protein